MIVLSVMVGDTYTGNIIQSAESSYGHHWQHTITLVPLSSPKESTDEHVQGWGFGMQHYQFMAGVFPFDVSTSRFWEDLGLPGAFAATAGPPSPTAATTSGRRGAGAHAGIGVADCNGGDGVVSRGRDEGGLHLRGRAIPIQSDELNLR